MANSNSNADRLMAAKAALVVTTNTPGWQFIKQIAANVVDACVQRAIDEEDSAKGEVLRRKAKAMQDGFRDFFNSIESTKSFEVQTEPDWFANLSFEAPAEQAIVEN